MDITVHFAARAIDAVRSVAAEEILPRYRSVTAQRKDDGSLVTAADIASQQALIRRLGAILPVPVIAEEMPVHEQTAIFDLGGRYWCVDPLDGTRNFSGGVPFFAVSVALMQDAQPLFGAVYDPIADEAFYAVRGAGAWLDSRQLVVPQRGPALSEAVAAVSLRSDPGGLRGRIKRHPPFAQRSPSGSSTLSWCHLAAGRIDLMLHSGQRMWDYAAGALILEEAGGRLGNIEPGDFWSAPPWDRSVVAARSAPLYEEWRAWIGAELVDQGQG